MMQTDSTIAVTNKMLPTIPPVIARVPFIPSFAPEIISKNKLNYIKIKKIIS